MLKLGICSDLDWVDIMFIIFVWEIIYDFDRFPNER